MNIPNLIELKNIPVGFKYYIPFSSDSIKIEPNIEDQYGQAKGYRIWINLNAKASIKKYSLFTVPITKKKGKLVVRYEFGEEFYENMLNYLIKYWENEKVHISLSEIRNELAKKNPEKEFSLLYSKNFSNYVERSTQSIQQKIQENATEEEVIKFQQLVKIAKLELQNLKEEELLSMEDFSQMHFNFKKPSNKNLSKIIKFLSNVGLSEEQENKIYSYLEINRLIDGMPLQSEGKHGVLLYGPPGTGKTTTMKAFFGVFETLGCSVFEVNAQSLVSRPQVGAFAAEISKQIFEPAIEKIIKKQMPCLVYVDEATALVSKPKTSGVSDWYQEGLDTLKNYLNRSKYPGIILCLATNAKISDLDETIVGDDGRLEAVYFDFLNSQQFEILWKDKLIKNLNLKKEELENWITNGYIDLLSNISANSVSGRFVANFCGKYREQYLSSNILSGLKGLIFRRDTGKNLTTENEEKEIDFWSFYENFLRKLKIRLEEEIKTGVEEIKDDHYFTLEERNAKIEELEAKTANKLREIEEILSELKSGVKPISKQNNIEDALNERKKFNEEFISIFNKLERTTDIIIRNKDEIKNIQRISQIYINSLSYVSKNFEKYLQANDKINYVEFNRQEFEDLIMECYNIFTIWVNKDKIISEEKFTFYSKKSRELIAYITNRI